MKHKLTSRRELARQAAAASAAASTALSAPSSNAQSDEAKPSPLEQTYFEHVRALRLSVKRRATGAIREGRRRQPPHPGTSAIDRVADRGGQPGRHAAISLPNGFGDHELSTGIQFVGPGRGEHLLLEAAARY